MAPTTTADLGDTQCSPEATAKDAAFRIHVDGTRTLRFDTEGSSFDTVLSLHDRPPLTNAGASLRFSADETHRNMNEDAATSFGIDEVTGRTQVFEGDTTGMNADITDTLGCGTQADCGDAVYRIHVSERTALRFAVEGTGYEPGVMITRADPAGVSGQYLPIAAGGRHSCAISAGEVFCWGADDLGQLGNGGALGAADSSAAARVSGITDAQSICTGLRSLRGDGRCRSALLGAVAHAGSATAAASVKTGGGREGYREGQTLERRPRSPARRFSCALLRDGASRASSPRRQSDRRHHGPHRSTPTLSPPQSASSRSTRARITLRESAQGNGSVFLAWCEGHGKLGD